MQSKRVEGSVTILWVPSHCGVDGNEEADRLAGKVTKLNQKDVPTTHNIARARVKKQRWQILHKRANEILKAEIQTAGGKEMDEKSTIYIFKSKM